MVDLTHIGESLIGEMFNRSAQVRTLFFGHLQKYYSSDVIPFAIPDLALKHCGIYGFDGEHRIDIALLLESKSIAIPCEAKLGLHRLTRTQFDARFLGKCSLSDHADDRIKGNMVSILERKLPPECAAEPVCVESAEHSYTLSAEWFLIVRKEVHESWRIQGRPSLSDRCVILTFEDIVKDFGGKSAFNDLVSELTRFDYYDKWLGGERHTNQN